MEACDCDAYEKNQYELSSRQNERDLSKMMGIQLVVNHQHIKI